MNLNDQSNHFIMGCTELEQKWDKKNINNKRPFSMVYGLYDLSYDVQLFINISEFSTNKYALFKYGEN